MHRCITRLNDISRLHFSAEITACLINTMVYTITTACPLVPLLPSQIKKIEKKANRTIRHSLKYTDSIGEEFLQLPLAENGLALQNLNLESVLSFIRTLSQIINKKLTTGTTPIIESLSAAIDLPGYNNNHLGVNAKNGPFLLPLSLLPKLAIHPPLPPR